MARLQSSYGKRTLALVVAFIIVLVCLPVKWTDINLVAVLLTILLAYGLIRFPEIRQIKKKPPKSN
jgi:hypothetical protein